MTIIHGILPSLLTPMNEDGSEVNYGALSDWSSAIWQQALTASSSVVDRARGCCCGPKRGVRFSEMLWNRSVIGQ